MLGVGDVGVDPSWLTVMVLALPLLAGCLGPNVPDGPEGFDTILIDTGYDSSERPDSRPQDEGVDLPEGHPAADLEVSLGIDPGPDYDGETWEYDEPCPNREGPHGTNADCSDFGRQDAYILPSPTDANNYTKIRYPLTGNGTVVFHVPRPVEIFIQISDRYTEELRDKAQDPDRCDEWPQAFSGRVGIEGEAERTRDPDSWVMVTGDARLSLHWYGVCPDRAAS